MYYVTANGYVTVLLIKILWPFRLLNHFHNQPLIGVNHKSHYVDSSVPKGYSWKLWLVKTQTCSTLRVYKLRKWQEANTFGWIPAHQKNLWPRNLLLTLHLKQGKQWAKICLDPSNMFKQFWSKNVKMWENGKSCITVGNWKLKTTEDYSCPRLF